MDTTPDNRPVQHIIDLVEQSRHEVEDALAQVTARLEALRTAVNNVTGAINEKFAKLQQTQETAASIARMRPVEVEHMAARPRAQMPAEPVESAQPQTARQGMQGTERTSRSESDKR